MKDTLWGGGGVQGLGRGGSRGCGSGGVGGRGTGPRDGANFATCVSNAYKKKKNDFFLKVPWGRGVPTGAGLVDRAVNQGPWLQERVWGGVGAGWQLQGGLGTPRPTSRP